MDSSRGTPGFVGRDAELAQLAGSLREAAAGRGSVVALVGEPGIGKTRTIEELVARAAVPDDRVLWGRCPEHGGAPSYWPWAQVFRAWIERHDDAAVRAVLGAEAARIGQMASAVRERVPDLVPPDGEDPDQARFLLFDAVGAVLRRMARGAPSIVVLDDLHWADPASLQLLGFLARELRGMPLLLIGTYREVEMARVPGRLESIVRVSQRIALRGLEPAQVREFIRATGGVDPGEALVDAIHRTTEGNPFFAAELVRVLKAEGGLVDARRGARPIRLPEEVRATVRRRLEPLSIDDRRLLSVAAVVGREFDLVLLQVVCELGGDRVLERLAAASAAHLVDEMPEVLGRFRFAHALIRETLYEDLTPTTRAQMHRRVAQALEAMHAGSVDPPLAELAHHAYHAAPLYEPATAIRHAVGAAERAERLLAHEEAVGHLERALELTALEPPDEDRRIDLLLALGRCAWHASDTGKARSAFSEAARRAQASGNAGGLIRGALGLQQAAGFSGGVDPGMVALLERALAACTGDRNPFRPYVLMALTAARYFSDEQHRCEGSSEEALALARELGDPNALAAALVVRHLTMLGPGDPAARLRLAEEALAGPVDALSLQTMARAHVARVLDLLELGDVVGAERHTEEFARLAEAWRLPAARWHAGVLRSTLAQLTGRFDDAHRLAAEALAARRDAHDPAIAQVFCLQRALHVRETGRLDEHLETTLATLADEFPAVRAWSCFLGQLRAETGREAAARATVDRLAADGFACIARDVHYLSTLATLAELVATLGDAERAAVLYPMLLPFADRCIVVSMWVPGCMGSAQRFLGLLAETTGDLDAAVRHLEAAAEMHARMGARPLTAHTEAELARVLAARNGAGDATRAASLLASARATAETLGMTRLRNRLAVTTAPAPVVPAASAPAVRAGLLREGDYWTLQFDDRALRLKDTKGIHYLATLLRHPGRELHVLDIAGGSEAAPDTAAVVDRGDAGEVLDAAARAAYARRLDDLRAERDEARRFDDAGRAIRAEREMAFLERELSRGVGLGGRSRRVASTSERARLNVTRAIGRVIEKIAADDPVLGQHLEATVRTGTFCLYAPDPRVPVVWDV